MLELTKQPRRRRTACMAPEKLQLPQHQPTRSAHPPASRWRTRWWQSPGGAAQCPCTAPPAPPQRPGRRSAARRGTPRTAAAARTLRGWQAHRQHHEVSRLESAIPAKGRDRLQPLTPGRTCAALVLRLVCRNVVGALDHRTQAGARGIQQGPKRLARRATGQLLSSPAHAATVPAVVGAR